MKSYGIIKRTNLDLNSLKKLSHRKCFLVVQDGYELGFASKVYGIYSITADTQDIIEGETIKMLNCL